MAISILFVMKEQLMPNSCFLNSWVLNMNAERHVIMSYILKLDPINLNIDLYKLNIPYSATRSLKAPMACIRS